MKKTICMLLTIILALAINQIRFKRYKRVVQTVLYAPHFIAIMVVCGMIRVFLFYLMP